MTQIYEISKFIWDALIAAANGDSITFALLEPRPDEAPERKKRLDREMDEVNDLINLDLLKDVSDKFAEQISMCKINHGFGYKVVSLTPIAVTMFTERTKKELPN